MPDLGPPALRPLGCEKVGPAVTGRLNKSGRLCAEYVFQLFLRLSLCISISHHYSSKCLLIIQGALLLTYSHSQLKSKVGDMLPTHSSHQFWSASEHLCPFAKAFAELCGRVYVVLRSLFRSPLMIPFPLIASPFLREEHLRLDGLLIRFHCLSLWPIFDWLDMT
jgi:hypothetical protein